MSQWVRPLHQVTAADAQWHTPQSKSFATTTHCGKVLEGAVEVAGDEKAEREGCCSACAALLAAREGTTRQAAPRPVAHARTSPVKKAAAKKTVVKRPAAKKTIRKPAPKGRSGKAPVAKRPVRRPRRKG